MFPLLGSLITGGAGLFGSLMSSSSNAANIAMQQQTNQMNVAENQKNRDFQEQMSNTAYQRASQDMQKAGLNPAAMFGGGSAASTPGGGVPNIQAPRSDPHAGMANLGKVAAETVNSAISGKQFERMTEEIANLKVENERIRASTVATQAVAGLTRQQTSTERERTATQEQTKGLEEARKILTASNIPQATIDRLEALGVLDNITEKRLGQIGVGKYGAGVAGKALDAAVPFVSGAKSALKYLHEWRYPKTGPAWSSYKHDSSGKWSAEERWIQ